jgi:hypothetical protein
METASRRHANPFQATRELRRSVAVTRYDEPVTSHSFPGNKARRPRPTNGALSPQIETAVAQAGEQRARRVRNDLEKDVRKAREDLRVVTHYETRRSRSYDEGEDVASLKQIIKDQQRRISELEAENERLKMEKVLGTGRERPVRIQSAADAPRDPMPRDRYAESQTPTRAHHEQRRDVALQRATRRQRKPEPRYVEPPPGTPPPPDGEPPPTPRGEVRIPQEASQRSSRMRRARDEQRMREDLARTVSVTRDDEPLTLYVAHDNVPLGEAMRGKKSDVLIETKHSSGKLCFVYGRVGYSGPAGEAPDASGALQLGSRGCWVLSLESCHARCVDPATKRRLATFECLSLIEGEAIPFSTIEDCRSFFRGCTSRVDVVLAPQRLRDDGRPPKSLVSVNEAPYLPYWDTDTPPRRLAPQFRSAGVGYIRLGDDMSRNGLSFISCDAASFLLDAGHAAPSASSTGRRRLEVAAPVDPSPLARSRKGVPAVHQW